MTKSTIYKQLLLYILFPVCLGFIILTAYSIFQTKNSLKKANQQEDNLLIIEIKHLMEFQDLALTIHEELLDKKMKNYSNLIVNQYLRNIKNIENIDLNEIRKKLFMDPQLEDIYIIDSTGLIINTTFSQDKHLNFFSFGEHHRQYLMSIFQNGNFVSERFTIEARTKRLRKYTYQPTVDKKYIVEIGTYSKKADEIVEYVKMYINKLADEPKTIKSVDLFIIADVPFSLNKDAVVIPEHSAILDNVLKSHSQRSVFTKKNDQNLEYDYIFLDIRNTLLYKGGVVRIISDRKTELEAIRKELLKLILFFSIASILILGIIYKKSKDIIAPIKKLVNDIKTISTGHFEKRASVEGYTEVVELAVHFNEMLDNISFKNKLADEQHSEIEAQRQNLIEINKSLEKLTVAVSKTNNAISIYDSSGKLEWFNEGFFRLYGYSFNEVIYNIGESIFKINSNPDIDKYLNICVRTKQPVDFESEANTKAGNRIWIQTTLSPLLDENNDIKNIIAIDSNISTLKNIEKKLKEQNKDITDSIYYAKKIQEAVLPDYKQIKGIFNEFFILLKPKTIVSGDFFWYHQLGDEIVIAAIDCTGHGIPGAFMSIISNSLLNKIVHEKGICEPSEIIHTLNRSLAGILNTRKDDAIGRDGINIALCKLNIKNYTLEYSGLFNPLYITTKFDLNVPEKNLKCLLSQDNNSLYEIRPDRFLIETIRTTNKFSTKIVQLHPGDCIYLFTDGFADQFGGPNNKKFKYANFKSLILEVQEYSLAKQKEILSAKFDQWQGDNEQVDDLLIVGIRI